VDSELPPRPLLLMGTAGGILSVASCIHKKHPEAIIQPVLTLTSTPHSEEVNPEDAAFSSLLGNSSLSSSAAANTSKTLQLSASAAPLANPFSGCGGAANVPVGFKSPLAFAPPLTTYQESVAPTPAVQAALNPGNAEYPPSKPLPALLPVLPAPASAPRATAPSVINQLDGLRGTSVYNDALHLGSRIQALRSKRIDFKNALKSVENEFQASISSIIDISAHQRSIIKNELQLMEDNLSTAVEYRALLQDLSRQCNEAKKFNESRNTDASISRERSAQVADLDPIAARQRDKLMKILDRVHTDIKLAKGRFARKHYYLRTVTEVNHLVSNSKDATASLKSRVADLVSDVVALEEVSKLSKSAVGSTASDVYHVVTFGGDQLSDSTHRRRNRNRQLTVSKFWEAFSNRAAAPKGAHRTSLGSPFPRGQVTPSGFKARETSTGSNGSKTWREVTSLLSSKLSTSVVEVAATAVEVVKSELSAVPSPAHDPFGGLSGKSNLGEPVTSRLISNQAPQPILGNTDMQEEWRYESFCSW
jgi:hypothetical protein